MKIQIISAGKYSYCSNFLSSFFPFKKDSIVTCTNTAVLLHLHKIIKSTTIILNFTCTVLTILRTYLNLIKL